MNTNLGNGYTGDSIKFTTFYNKLSREHQDELDGIEFEDKGHLCANPNCDNNLYYNPMAMGCQRKKPDKLYDVKKFNTLKFKENDTLCIDICDPGLKLLKGEELEDPRCLKVKKEINDSSILKILKIINFLSLNINIYNDYTYAFIINKLLYIKELMTINKEAICAIGKAKILVDKDSSALYSDLVNIINIYGAILYIHTKGTDFYDNKLLNVIGDIGCNVGELNVYFQDIYRNYNIEYIENIDELKSIISVDEFIKLVKEDMSKLFDYFYSNKNYFLEITPTDDDEIGGDGFGTQANIKYLLFYIFKFLKNKNIKEFCFDIDELLKLKLKSEFKDTKDLTGVLISEQFYKQINEKYTMIDEHATGGDLNKSIILFEQKYIKYKQKYLNLKKLIDEKR